MLYGTDGLQWSYGWTWLSVWDEYAEEVELVLLITATAPVNCRSSVCFVKHRFSSALAGGAIILGEAIDIIAYV